LLKDEGKQESLSQNIKELALPNATNKIINQVEKLIDF
jgi:UDP-N-acetylglucosamine--N-acetylmuramyl-(pentapeptide) pyrophosphoryl-undecaprenol N-acetylglucosamine transferase